MKASIIFTTYNAVAWLEKVLWGFQFQEEKDFELIIADDGSGKGTRDLIRKMAPELPFEVNHVWQEDEGFRKCEILNKAIKQSRSEYLIFTDGDCIPRKDFVHTHLDMRKPGYFLSGGYLKLPMNISQKITREDIQSGNCFELEWLLNEGLPKKFSNKKLTLSGSKAALMNLITPTNASWNGHNASGWKKDILNVNGFDERMRYGSEDREFGERLCNSGIKSRQIRYSAVCIHLDHSRGYVNDKDLQSNAAIRKETNHLKKTWTEYGIIPGPKPVIN